MSIPSNPNAPTNTDLSDAEFEELDELLATTPAPLRAGSAPFDRQRRMAAEHL